MGIISFAASYSNLQTSTQEVKNANQDVKPNCLIYKTALLNASKISVLTLSPQFIQKLSEYNSQCIALTGRNAE
jgi:hypothetical protein